MVPGFIKKIFSKDSGSKGMARNRLHFVLVQDRAEMEPGELTQFRSDLIGVIERYFIIDEKEIDIAYGREENMTTLLINSPVIVRKRTKEERALLTYDGGEKEGSSKKKLSTTKDPESSENNIALGKSPKAIAADL